MLPCRARVSSARRAWSSILSWRAATRLCGGRTGVSDCSGGEARGGERARPDLLLVCSAHADKDGRA
eukprot:6178820-Pleurochrysis_carterae.AAC.1